MHKQKGTFIIGLVFVAALVSFLPLTAQAYMLKYDSTSAGLAFGGYIGDTAYNGTAGIYSLSIQVPSSTFQAFCIENVYSSTQYSEYSLVPIATGDQDAVRAAWLFNAYRLGGLNTYATGNTLAAATQVAIWELMTETGTGHNVLSGGTSTSMSYAALAQTLVDLALGANISSFNVSGYALAISNNHQDFLVPLNSSEGSIVSAVPVPPAVWLLGSGLVGLVGLRKRLKK
jgi:hypothetical protein